MTSLSRRSLLLGAAALSTLPALASPPTAIARAWTRAEALRAAMAPHSRAIEVAFRSGGVPGWMRLKGEAYALGERRYSLLVEILNAPPTSAADLAMQRLAADDSEMRDGPRDWACGRLALAERRLLAAA